MLQSQSGSSSGALDGPQGKKNLFKLTIAALGIVFGDIGTSPLYAFRQCLATSGGMTSSQENVLGILSLMIWTLTLVVCIKYLMFVVRADNRGEGGILALISLASAQLKNKKGKAALVLVLLGIVGASLLYSDGVLTPAVSVLSAVEGLNTISPQFKPYVIPIALVILVILFSFQSRGTSKVGRLFGPVMILWFGTIAVLGVVSISQNTAILQAMNPWYALQFIGRNGTLTLVILSAVFLAMTGAEVLYADLGHFGRKPIRRGWFFLVFPALLLNYMGQGALVLNHPEVTDTFYSLAPSWFQYPLVVIATMATVIASQAVISGAFSLARQSVQLGFWPRMQVRHTSSETIGQVYVPFVNWVLLFGTVALVLGFQESGRLASAYGIAVSTDMLITFCLMIFIALRLWKVKLPLVIPFILLFFTIDGSFFVANIGKIANGGWIVVLVAVVIFFLMTTWRKGRLFLRKEVESTIMSVDIFAQSIALNPPVRVKGTAVFLAGNPNGVPIALLHNLKHNRILHENTFLVSVLTDETPTVLAEHRAVYKDFGQGIGQVILHFGFSESPDIPATLRALGIPGLELEPTKTTYFLGRESLVIAPHKRTMPIWRKKLFWFMSHNALNATNFFRLPPNQVVEISAQTEL